MKSENEIAAGVIATGVIIVLLLGSFFILTKSLTQSKSDKNKNET